MEKKIDKLSLEGKVAIISGGASGIGLGTAKLLAQHGAKIAMIDVNDEGKKEADKINKEGGYAEFFKCDVTSYENVKNTVNEIKDRFDKVDILFNNAGVTVRKTVVELEEHEWDFVINVGLKGTYLLSKFVIPIMAENGGGSIINTGSGWGLKGGDDAAAYCAVKGGIVNLTRAMAIDHGKDNIRVNSVNPGDTDTAMLRDEGVQTGLVKDAESEEIYLKDCGTDRPLARIGMPEDIANAVLFLCSDLSSWVTGSALVVDGGGIA
ncbi:SDR family NAD(P)-dependent oxidoreductase [Anaeromicrobium sediminis]|uniref:Short-chain dehydrogenase n=1 Tax=Anaeromicrobium sediminis TaxID=1478221 RepID=A0A267MG09_9FIRM|nr:SDR family oxidoreductase [Anaeromicrobium sediminis]PAB58486.1 short-chain dehydrogenase [Anaeromicrobium sediminis]